MAAIHLSEVNSGIMPLRRVPPRDTLRPGRLDEEHSPNGSSFKAQVSFPKG